MTGGEGKEGLVDGVACSTHSFSISSLGESDAKSSSGVKSQVVQASDGSVHSASSRALATVSVVVGHDVIM